MNIHPIAHKIYLRVKAELTDGMPENTHALILKAGNITEERIDSTLRGLVKQGWTHRQAEDAIMKTFRSAIDAYKEGK